MFQENSLEGVKSLIELGADGYEIDIYLTNYGQLVVFHDDNAKVSCFYVDLNERYLTLFLSVAFPPICCLNALGECLSGCPVLWRTFGAVEDIVSTAGDG